MHLVHQCFAVQNTYGKTADQLSILMDAMCVDLIDYDLDVIERSFTDWRKTRAIIPTPAQMIELCSTNQRRADREKNPKPPARPANQPTYKPDYFEGKFWAQFELHERDEFIAGLKKMPPELRAVACRTYHAPQKLVERSFA